jgi:hypothetical protein
MKHAVEMGSCAMIYIPNFIKTSAGNQRLVRGVTDQQTHRQHGYSISQLSFFQKKQITLKHFRFSYLPSVS